jgi:hypothetical protein
LSQAPQKTADPAIDPKAAFEKVRKYEAIQPFTGYRVLDMRVGEVSRGDSRSRFLVLEILGENEVVMKHGPERVFLLKGFSTQGLVDGMMIKFDDTEVLEVKGTVKQRGHGTIFLVQNGEAGRKPTAAEYKAAGEEADRQARDEALAKAARQNAAKKPAPPKPGPEEIAAAKLVLAKQLLKDKQTGIAKIRLKKLIEDFPDTQAAKEAKKLLEKLDK